MMMENNAPNKYYNENTGVKVVEPTQAILQQQQQPSLFWPTSIAECDTSFLEGSVVYTPSKLPFKVNAMPPDLLTFNGINQQNYQQQQLHQLQHPFKNNSYNSNGSSSSNSQNSNANNVFATSNSSLLLNGDGTSGLLEANNPVGVYQTNLIQPNFNLAEKFSYNSNTQNSSNMQNICPVFTHTGSPNSSDNE